MTSLAPRAEPAAQVPSPGDSFTPFLNRPGILERAILFLALFTYAWGTPIEWLSFANERAATSSALTQLLFLAFFVNTIVSLNGNWHVVLRASKGEPLVPAFVLLIVFSTAWSTLPASTLQDGIVLVITYLTAMHLIVRFSVREAVAMFAWVFAIGALINLGFVFAFEGAVDSVALSTQGGSQTGWRGITPSKNTLGRSAVLGFLACTVHARSVRSWVLWPAAALVNALIVLGTNSATSLGALLGVVTLGVVFLGFRGRKTLYGATMVAMLVVFSALTALAATNLATFTGLLGKDSNFTGRLPIWENSFLFGVSERPVLGFGWGGFWRHGIVDFDVQLRSNNFDIPHSHNAWIDAWLQVGPLGAVMLAGIFARGLIWGTRHIRAVPTAIGMFPALTISLGVIYSSTEAGFVSRSIQFIMLIVALTVAANHKGVERPFEGPASQDGTQVDPSLPAFTTR